MNDQKRRTELIAAAAVLRSAVHAQRTGRSVAPAEESPVIAVASVASAVSAPVIVAPEPPTAAVDTSAAAPVPLPVAIPPSPGADWPARAAASAALIIRGSAAAATFSGRWWRQGLATLLVVGMIGAARTYWPSVASSVKSELAERRAPNRPRVTSAAPPREAPAKVVATAPVAGTGRLQIESTPDHARVSVDGRDRGETPLTIDVSPGNHQVVLQAPTGTIRRTVAVAQGQTTEVSEAIFSGWLHVSSPIELTVSEGARRLTLNERNQVMIEPGSHEVRFENRRLRFAATRRLDVRPFEMTSVTIELPLSPLQVTSSEPADVSIDGEMVGETPLTNRTLPVGLHEFVVTSRLNETRRITVTVTTEPTRLDIDFSRP